MISKTFCILPWIHIAINTRGIYRLCCNESYLAEGYIESGLCKAHEVSIEEIWNGKSYRDIRVKMLNGEKVPACRRCYSQEDFGIKTKRLIENETFPTLDDLDPNGFCPTSAIKYIDVRLGNKCNLMCRMCNPSWSNKFIAEKIRTGYNRFRNEEVEGLDKMDWFKKDFFWDNIMSVMENCSHVYFAGGETALFQDRQIKLFKKCIENDIAKNLMIRFNTNATIPFDRLLKYWQEFKEVRITCSIDGFDKVNDYIRYPSKWKNIDKNLTSIYKFTQDINYNIKMDILCTVQMYNIFGLVDLFEYLKKFNTFPALNILQDPTHYDIRVLTEEKKREVTDMLLSWNENNKKWLNKNARPHHHDRLLRMIDFMNKEDLSHLYIDFWKETNILDILRNQKMKDYIPELD